MVTVLVALRLLVQLGELVLRHHLRLGRKAFEPLRIPSLLGVLADRDQAAALWAQCVFVLVQRIPGIAFDGIKLWLGRRNPLRRLTLVPLGDDRGALRLPPAPPFERYASLAR